MNFSIFTKLGRAVVMALAVAALVLTGCGDDNGGNSDGGGGGNNTGGVVDPNTVIKGTFTYGGQTYKTVKIGGQTWMAENLNVSTSDSWCYENSTSNCAEYGRLYTWGAAKSACQSVGWRLPTRAEWGQLAKAVGGTGNYGIGGTAGKALKSTNDWSSYNGTDSYGFKALPGGLRISGDTWDYIGDLGYWWAATESGSGYAYYREMRYDNDLLDEGYFLVGNGSSVRCVKDE